MMGVRSALAITVLLLISVVLQTTLFAQIEVFTPDVVMLIVILLPLTRIKPELLLGVAFISGLAMDLLGSAVLGLRAMVFTVVAYLAIRTRDRADMGRIIMGFWAALLSLVGVVLLLVVGTLFGQTVLLGEGLIERIFFVPLANLILALAFAPLFVRVINRDTTAFRYV